LGGFCGASRDFATCPKPLIAIDADDPDSDLRVR
jgi:hypothetical protein